MTETGSRLLRTNVLITFHFTFKLTEGETVPCYFYAALLKHNRWMNFERCRY